MSVPYSDYINWFYV